MEKIAVLIDLSADYKSLKKELNGKGQIQWICFSAESFFELGKKENSAFFEDFLEEKDFEKIDFAAENFSKNWFLLEGKDIAQFNGISLSEMNHYENRIFFTDFFKNFAAIENILGKNGFEKIFFTKNFCQKKSLNLIGEKSEKIQLNEIRGIGKKESPETVLFNLKRGFLKSLGKIFLLFRKKAERKNSGGILFFGVLAFYGNGIFNELLNGKTRVLVVNLNIADRQKVVEGVEHLKLEQLIDKKILKKSEELKKKLCMQKSELFAKPDFAKKFEFGGKNFFPALEDFIELQFCEKFPQTVEDILLCDKLLETEKPEIIVTWADTIMTEKCLVSIAKQKEIPTIVLQHGLTSAGYIPSIADKIALWSEFDKRFLKNFGIGEENLVITGNPRHDELLLESFSGKKDFFKKNNIPPEKKLAVFATQPLVQISSKMSQIELQKISKDAVKIFEKMENAELVFAVHPSDDEKFYEKICFGIENAKVVRPARGDKAFAKWVFFCDLLLTHSSTTAVEAAVLKKPVISINYSAFPDLVNFPRKLSENAKNESEFFEKSNRLLFDENFKKAFLEKQQNFLEKNFFLDGKSAERVKNLIYSLKPK